MQHTHTLLRFCAIMKDSSSLDDDGKKTDKSHLNSESLQLQQNKTKLNQNITHMRLNGMHSNVWAFHHRYLLFNKYLLSANKNIFRSSFSPAKGALDGFYIRILLQHQQQHHGVALNGNSLCIQTTTTTKIPTPAAKYHIYRFHCCYCFCCCYYCFIRINFPMFITFLTISYTKCITLG